MKEKYRSPPFNLDGYVAFAVKYADGTRRTVLQHREVLEKQLGRKLFAHEIVHHKNEVRSDNRPNNLELHDLVSHGKHHAKYAEMMQIVCPQCGQTAFVRGRSFRHNQLVAKKAGPFCGKSCAGAWSREKQMAAGQINLRNPKKLYICSDL